MAPPPLPCPARIVVCGAGIGGLTAALALQAAGLRDVTVVDCSPAGRDRSAGAGISIDPDAMRVLQQLGLAEQVAGAGLAPIRQSVFAADGEPQECSEIGVASDPEGLPHVMVAGERLLKSLDLAASSRLGDAGRLTSLNVVGYVEDSSGVLLQLEDTSSGQPAGALRADMVIDADGVLGDLRKSLSSDDANDMLEDDSVLFHGVVESPRILDGATLVRAGTEEHHIVCSQLAELATGSENDDKMVDVNFVVAVPNTDSLRAARSPSNSTEILTLLDAGPEGAFTLPFLNLRRMLDDAAAAGTLRRWACPGRDRLTTSVSGSIVHLREAAYPLFKLEGRSAASAAILDARDLAETLANGSFDDVRDRAKLSGLLEVFEATRLPSMTDSVCRDTDTEDERCVQPDALDGTSKGLIQRFGVRELLANFTPFERVLMTTNGTLQQVVASYFNDDVKVVPKYTVPRAGANGETVFDREVDLFVKTHTGEWHHFAICRSTVSVSDEALRKEVEAQTVGIGQIFRDYNIRPFFQLQSAGRGLYPTTGAPCITRQYELSCELITCIIHEQICVGDSMDQPQQPAFQAPASNVVPAPGTPIASNVDANRRTANNIPNALPRRSPLSQLRPARKAVPPSRTLTPLQSPSIRGRFLMGGVTTPRAVRMAL